MISGATLVDVRFGVHAPDWRAALRCAGALLVEHGCVSPDYVLEMEQAVEAYGPYIVVAPGVAIPHASPSDRVRTTGFGLLRLQEPVLFGSQANDPVCVLLPVAVADCRAHVEIISVLSRLLMLPGMVQALREAPSADSIRALLSGNQWQCSGL